MHILITRPEPDASETRRLLEGEGHTADVAPMLEISVGAPESDLLAAASALVVTSRNGLRSLEQADLPEGLLSLPVLVVGRSTGAAARALGFRDVTVGPATAKDLVPLIVAAWTEKIVAKGGVPGPVLHLSGDKISFDLLPPMTQAGIAFARSTVYHSSPARDLPTHVRACLERGGYDAIILMSPLSADTFVQLVMRLQLAEGARRAAYVCFSNGIAQRLASLGAEQVYVAAKPNIEEVLALISSLAAQSGPLSPPGKKSDSNS